MMEREGREREKIRKWRKGRSNSKQGEEGRREKDQNGGGEGI